MIHSFLSLWYPIEGYLERFGIEITDEDCVDMEWIYMYDEVEAKFVSTVGMVEESEDA